MNRRKKDYNEEEDAPDLDDYRSIRLCNLHKKNMIYMACDAYEQLKRLSADICDREQEKDFFEKKLREFDAEYQELLRIIDLLEDREKEAINVPVSKL